MTATSQIPFRGANLRLPKIIQRGLLDGSVAKGNWECGSDWFYGYGDTKDECIDAWAAKYKSGGTVSSARYLDEKVRRLKGISFTETRKSQCDWFGFGSKEENLEEEDYR